MDLLDLVHAAPGEERGFFAFGDWSREELLALREIGRVESHPADTVIIRAGSREDTDLYVLLEGKLEVYRNVGSDVQTLASLEAGEIFGEMAFVDGQPRSATVRAVSPARVLHIRAADLDALAQRDPRTALRFMREIARILSHRLRRAEA